MSWWDIAKQLQLGNCSANVSNNSVAQTYEKLKKLHHWADKSLIEDIMDAVDNDVDEASNLLKQMVPTDCFEKNTETSFVEWESDSEDILLNYNALGANNGIALEESEDFDDKNLIEDIMAAVNNDFDKASTLLKEMVSSDCFEKNKETHISEFEDFLFDNNTLEDGLYYNEELMDDHTFGGKMFRDNGGLMDQMMGNLSFTPVETEREEDDIYLSHRKDAMRMMRSASNHSKAAKEAYLRRDHVSAQHFSLKAKEELEVAKRLNAEAARQILSIKNCKNDLWTLDLHGLHVAEAVEALQEHLQKIESQGPNLVTIHNITGMLQVITGRGNHSKGEAPLLVAIRSFLSENRYHYDEARPGVITVRPKFCQGQNALKNNGSSFKFPISNVSKDIETPFQLGNLSAELSNKLILETNKPNTVFQTYEKLKTLHPWADKILIEEVMAVVNNDIDEASVLLKEMISDDCFEKNKETRDEKPFQLGDYDELTNKLILETNKPNDVFQAYEKLKKLHPWGDESLIEEILSVVNNDIDEASSLLKSMVSSDLYEKKKEISIVDWDGKPLQFRETNVPNTVLQTYEKLKKFHPWADKSLIEEIMEAVNNDIDLATILLKEMASDDCFEKNKETSIADLEFDFGNLLLHDSALGANDNGALADGLNYNKELMDGHTFGGKMLSDLDGLTEPEWVEWEGDDIYSRFIPIEPEREEGDIYLIHRKDAMRMNSLASQHSKAAKEAYKRKDHVSAQHFSLKAKQEWEVAKRLNAEAAKKILRIKNRKHDMWTLDLHGLHVAEAVEALQAHLQKIESRGPLNFNNETCMTGFESLEALSRMYMEKLDKQPSTSGQRSLHVITGRGIHSKGEAPLPVAIRSFLTANRYHYDEARLGVITVRPKFRSG